MIEVGIGVLFAVMFVAAYLLVSKFLRAGEQDASRWRAIGNIFSGCSRIISEKPARLFLTTGEMREHHSGKNRSQPNSK